MTKRLKLINNENKFHLIKPLLASTCSEDYCGPTSVDEYNCYGYSMDVCIQKDTAGCTNHSQDYCPKGDESACINAHVDICYSLDSTYCAEAAKYDITN